jgi:hypothetical protein
MNSMLLAFAIHRRNESYVSSHFERHAPFMRCGAFAPVSMREGIHLSSMQRTEG